MSKDIAIFCDMSLAPIQYFFKTFISSSNQVVKNISIGIYIINNPECVLNHILVYYKTFKYMTDMDHNFFIKTITP